MLKASAIHTMFPQRWGPKNHHGPLTKHRFQYPSQELLEFAGVGPGTDVFTSRQVILVMDQERGKILVFVLSQGSMENLQLFLKGKGQHLDETQFIL